MHLNTTAKINIHIDHFSNILTLRIYKPYKSGFHNCKMTGSGKCPLPNYKNVIQMFMFSFGACFSCIADATKHGRDTFWNRVYWRGTEVNESAHVVCSVQSFQCGDY